jgi:ribonuclease HI
MNFPFNKLDPAKGALPADICRAAGWQDPREPIEIATPVRRATVECNQKKWAEYGKKLKRTVRAGMHEMLNNPNYKRAERQKYSDSESSDSSDSSDVELDPSEDEEPDRKKDGRHKPLSDKKIRDKAYTRIRVQQQPYGTIFIFTDGSHIAKDKSKTTEDLCGWGLTIHLADPAEGTGFGKCLLERWGPVRLDRTHIAFVGAVDLDNNVAELNGLIQAFLAVLGHPVVIDHVAFVADSEIAIGLFEGTNTSNKYVALTLVGLDLLALIRLQGTTYEFIHVRGHTRDKGNDAADTNADKGNLSSGGRPDSTAEPPRELPYNPVVEHTLQGLRSEIGTDDRYLNPQQGEHHRHVSFGMAYKYLVLFRHEKTISDPK